MKYTITDENTGIRMISFELAKGFAVKGHSEIEEFPLNARLKLIAELNKDKCQIHYETGECYVYEKIKSPELKYMYVPCNDNGRYYANVYSISEELDRIAFNVLKKNVSPSATYELSDNLKKKLETSVQNMVNNFVAAVNQAAGMVNFPIGHIIRNYLCDGAVNIYEENGKILTVFAWRQGIEYDVVTGSGLSEELSDVPFGQGMISPYARNSNCEWEMPCFVYMISEDKADLKEFLQFLDTVTLEEDVLAYNTRLQQQVAAKNQMHFNNMFANQAAGWAASDRLGQTLSQDLNQFHNSLNSQMAQFDARIDLSGTQSESSDERIQRLRHESIMGVETYERNDGTVHEFDNSADRVFENNLDNTSHFGTRNYYDDYVPEGWHEMKKKQ